MMPQKTFHVANFGCRVSQAEGAAIHAELSAGFATESDSPFNADLLIVNSCTVTEEADREVRRLIRKVNRRRPSTKIIVTGCYAQRRPEQLQAMPGVDYVVGHSHRTIIGSLAAEEAEFDDGRAAVFCSEISREHRLSEPAFLGSAGRTRATVKVQDGCNATCSFCIIPAVRGPGRSLSPDRVVGQVRHLVETGFREVVFSGIHLGSYGRDLTPRSSLSALVRETLDDVPGLERLRLSSIEPLEVTPQIVDLVASHSRIASHLHVPLQSGSSRILQAMRRPYRAGDYSRLLGRIREAAPDAALGADVMVGFPGETDDDFLQTYHLIDQSPLTYLHVFPYSSRPGTRAAEMTPPVPTHVARFRGQRLRELIGRKNEAFRGRFVGRRLGVLVLDVEAKSGWRMGLSDNFIKVRVPEALEVNRWHQLAMAQVSGAGLDAVSLQDSMTTTAADTF